MIEIKKHSAWTYRTSDSSGAGIGPVAVSGGKIGIAHPGAQQSDPPSNWLHYRGGGLGLSWGLKKIPKIGHLIDKRGISGKGSGSHAPGSFDSWGHIFVLNSCPHDELTLHDFKGACVFVDLGAGLIAGYSGVALLMHVNVLAMSYLAAGPVGLATFHRFAHPHAMMISHGWNIGPQASAGVDLSMGLVY